MVLLKSLCVVEELRCEEIIHIEDYGLIHLHIFRLHIGFYKSESSS